jgi:hypothetical protein
MSIRPLPGLELKGTAARDFFAQLFFQIPPVTILKASNFLQICLNIRRLMSYERREASRTGVSLP